MSRLRAASRSARVKRVSRAVRFRSSPSWRLSSGRSCTSRGGTAACGTRCAHVPCAGPWALSDGAACGVGMGACDRGAGSSSSWSWARPAAGARSPNARRTGATPPGRSGRGIVLPRSMGTRYYSRSQAPISPARTFQVTRESIRHFDHQADSPHLHAAMLNECGGENGCSCCWYRVRHGGIATTKENASHASCCH